MNEEFSEESGKTRYGDAGQYNAGIMQLVRAQRARWLVAYIY